MKQLSLLLILSLVGTAVSWGCWALPPEYVVVETEADGLFLRKCNRQAVIEIRESKELGLVWKVEIDDFNQLFSSFYLTPNGKKLIHVKGNHMVNQLDEYCIDIYTFKGKVDGYKASEFYDELPLLKGLKTSVSPTHLWMKKVMNVSNERIHIETHKHGTILAFLDEHKSSNGGKQIKAE
ncbi:hypothetical protein QEH52_19910 [Coraliomargarita sp. SDUM461003]|uniref:Lipoprotein n=1 Tax=Thalassobacterium maritimum TaxID=3041265 RepID=A0ABU1B2H4_9BACT|nr:hypothetical protein [Coraliomargarita sp. SDUM461003]MBT61994.1 hypothetical protein [Puniceicoccaceae bacterium]MDQ8209795.1 hypothetical protein [Coraliomargarita sp. SDUM461003]|tara:strand:+ start:920 stop:1459 length:540 start_codon:yes stop_codon:yes gene_type:complete